MRGTDSAREPGVVLVVDDDAATRTLVARILVQGGLSCIEAASGEEALAVLEARGPIVDCVLLDVRMPGASGFDVLKTARQRDELAAIPVIFLTAHADAEADVVEGAALGAADHLSKPFSAAVLTAKVRRAVHQHREHRRIAGKLEQAERLARIDPLTQLGNRQLLLERMREELAYAKRNRTPLALAMMDLDHFKRINDELGHEAGDEALRHFARTLASVIRQEDAAFRHGGEEFVLLLRGADARAALVTLGRVREALKARLVDLGGQRRVVTFSAGVAVVDEADEYSKDELFARADSALYRAKSAGRDRDEVG
jgi:diguanylate cyclase (GGDEF)-like protein